LETPLTSQEFFSLELKKSPKLAAKLFHK